MPPMEKQVRVFVSSTFRDMHAERDHLVTVVFPELRERVERLGLEFFDVDLRWGVPDKTVDGEKTNSWEYCRQWIERVEPLFVCILGQRYGWVPEATDFKSDEDKARQKSKPRSITDLEVRHAVLDGRRKRRSYFYLRAVEAPASAREYVDPPPLLGKLEQLKKDVRTCGRPVRDYPCEWKDDAFTKLDAFGTMVLDDLWSGVLRDERYVSKDVWRKVLGTDPETDSRYIDESKPVPRELWVKIVEAAKPPPKDPLEAERDQMHAFADSRLRWFQGRTIELQQLTDFITSVDETAPRLAVVAAVPGQGKSALLAKLSTLIPQPSTFLITHFVGATERSASAHALVERLLGELDRSGISWPAVEKKEGEEPKRDFNSLCLWLAQRLGDYAGERRIVILLDAINQLSDGHDLTWLPNRLGPAVRVIVSCIDDSSLGGPRSVVAENPKSTDAKDRVPPTPEHLVLQALASRQPAPLRVPLGPLTEPDVRTIVVAYLQEYCKELDAQHVNAICSMPQACNPLYLLVMLAELRTLGGNEMNEVVPKLIASMPQKHPDTVSLFRWVLQRLEVFGPEAVRWWCLYLAHGQAGMASHELADLLACKLGADAAATSLLIERGLRRYLQRRGMQLDFFHGQLRHAVIDRYGPQAEATKVHADIATYFRNLADPAKNQSWKGDSPRPFLQLVFHLVGAEQAEEYCETLCDLRFVEARCRVGQVFELISDYRLAQENLPEAQADLREKRTRHERAQQWASELIEYSRQWSERRDRLSKGEKVEAVEPRLPVVPAACRMWTEVEIEAECDRILKKPTRRDRIEAFAGFATSQCYPLAAHGDRPGFVLQHAFNAEPGGAVHDRAAVLLPSLRESHLLRRWPPSALPNVNPALLRTLEGHSDGVMSVSVTSDGRHAVSGSQDKTLRVWDLQSGACLRTLEGHIAGVMSVSVTPDGRRGVSGSLDKTIRVWDMENGACLRTLEGHSSIVLSVSVTPDGRCAVSGSQDKTLRVWDLESGACLRTLEGHVAVIWSVSVTPDGRRAVSGSGDNTLRMWDLESGVCLLRLEGHSEVVRSVSVTPDGQRVVSGGNDNTLRVWDLKSGECLRTLEGHNGCVWSVSVTPDGRRGVSGSYDNTLCVWDLESGACLRTLEGHRGNVKIVSVTPDGRRAVSWSQDKTLRVWDLEIGVCLRTLEGHSSWVSSVSVTPDGWRAVSGSDDSTLRVWDLKSGMCLRTLEGHSSGVNSVSVTPDGWRAVSGSDDSTLRVWDLKSGMCLRTLEGHSSGVNSVSMTPEGRRAVSWSQDKTLRVWDMESGACLRTLEGHSSWVSSVSVTPDGRGAVSGSGDKTVRVWDLETGACLEVCSMNAPVGATAIYSGTLAIGLGSGEVLFAEMRNMPSGPSIPVPEPAYATDEAYEELLRRGLEQCRQTKGDHENTLGHLTALAVHLESVGKRKEAAEFKREYDEMKARVGAGKK